MSNENNPIIYKLENDLTNPLEGKFYSNLIGAVGKNTTQFMIHDKTNTEFVQVDVKVLPVNKTIEVRQNSYLDLGELIESSTDALEVLAELKKKDPKGNYHISCKFFGDFTVGGGQWVATGSERIVEGKDIIVSDFNVGNEKVSKNVSNDGVYINTHFQASEKFNESDFVFLGYEISKATPNPDKNSGEGYLWKTVFSSQPFVAV